MDRLLYPRRRNDSVLKRFTKKCSRPKTPINKLRLFRGFANAPPFQSFENRSVSGESEPSELISILDWPHYFVNRSSGRCGWALCATKPPVAPAGQPGATNPKPLRGMGTEFAIRHTRFPARPRALHPSRCTSSGSTVSVQLEKRVRPASK